MSRTSTGSSSRRSPGAVDPFPVPQRPSEIRGALRALGLRPARRLGQSFLTDPFVADAEAALLEAPEGAPVVEVGGGLGILTLALVRRGAAPLTVIERDPRLAEHLRTTFGSRIEVREDDALRLPLARHGFLIGNLPYSIATPVLLRAFEARVTRGVFLVQREIARRLASRPGTGDYGRLALIADLYGTIELFREVPGASFEPAPEVDSQIVLFRGREGPLPVASVATFEAVVRRLFASRRKQLGNLLPRLAGSDAAAERLARRAEWPEGWSRQRPEELPPEAYFRLANALEPGALAP